MTFIGAWIGQVHSPIRAREGQPSVKMCIGLIIGKLGGGLTLVIDHSIESTACKLISIHTNY